MLSMCIAHHPSELHAYAGGVVVPTMGGLHEGHGALIELARHEADARGGLPVVVTVFVNPKQFEEAHDYERYPRTLAHDSAICEASGADCVFAPPVEEVYPPGGPDGAGPIPAVARGPGLEDRYRPGHLEGVCAVVHRLFELTRAGAAVFGEKDWQQLQLARALSRERGLGVEIIPGETVREADGLAMSSRNRFLTPEDRPRADALYRALSAAQREDTPEAAESRMHAILEEAGVMTEYAAVRDAETLLAWSPGRPGRSLVAARLGAVRLIDNMAWIPPGLGRRAL
ncbi:MAG: pantoate--beta-alanine ligase [Phycisphaerales bacterium]